MPSVSPNTTSGKKKTRNNPLQSPKFRNPYVPEKKLNGNVGVYEGIYNNQQIVYVFTALLGLEVTIQVKNGATYHGILTTMSADASILLRCVHRVSPPIDEQKSPNNNPTHADIEDYLAFNAADVVELVAKDVDYDSCIINSNHDSTYLSQNQTFRIDSEISNGQAAERELQPFDCGSDSHFDPSLCLEDQDGENGWAAEDMLNANQSKFGIESSYDDLHYTTEIDKNASDYHSKREWATEVAESMESDLRHKQNSMYDLQLEGDEFYNKDSNSVISGKECSKGGFQPVTRKNQRGNSQKSHPKSKESPSFPPSRKDGFEKSNASTHSKKPVFTSAARQQQLNEDAKSKEPINASQKPLKTTNDKKVYDEKMKNLKEFSENFSLAKAEESNPGTVSKSAESDSKSSVHIQASKSAWQKPPSFTRQGMATSPVSAPSVPDPTPAESISKSMAGIELATTTKSYLSDCEEKTDLTEIDKTLENTKLNPQASCFCPQKGATTSESPMTSYSNLPSNVSPPGVLQTAFPHITPNLMPAAQPTIAFQSQPYPSAPVPNQKRYNKTNFKSHGTPTNATSVGDVIPVYASPGQNFPPIMYSLNPLSQPVYYPPVYRSAVVPPQHGFPANISENMYFQPQSHLQFSMPAQFPQQFSYPNQAGTHQVLPNTSNHFSPVYQQPEWSYICDMATYDGFNYSIPSQIVEINQPGQSPSPSTLTSAGGQSAPNPAAGPVTVPVPSASTGMVGPQYSNLAGFPPTAAANMSQPYSGAAFIIQNPHAPAPTAQSNPIQYQQSS